MASSSSKSKVIVGKEVLNMKLISNEFKQPNFRAILDIVYKQDPSSVLSMIPLQVLMIQDVGCCYTYKVGSIGDMEIRETYGKLCENGVLKEEYQKLRGKSNHLKTYVIHATSMDT